MNQAAGHELELLVRTLTAAGYSIEQFARQPAHAEFVVRFRHELGVDIRYLVALAEGGAFTTTQIEEIKQIAKDNGVIPVLVASQESVDAISIDDLLHRLGGPVPTWRALSTDYRPRLSTLATNVLPEGLTGEAWRHFEEAVSDGLEFIFGLRVKRLGGAKRGQKVPDCIARAPADTLLLVDSKAANGGFDASADNLRALSEYVTQQSRIQIGKDGLTSSLIVSSAFVQSADRLREIGAEFLADLGIPLAFLTADGLGDMVDMMRENGRARNSVRWRRVFSVAGLVDPTTLRSEITLANELAR